MRKLTQQAWDKLSIYLPVVLMAFLALTTYWLVRSTQTSRPPEKTAAVTHEPDYFMSTFLVRTFDVEGRLKSEVIGIKGRHFPDNDTLEIDQAKIRSFNAQGQLTVATANRALSNGDGSEVQLFGNAVVTRQPLPKKNGLINPKLEFRSEFLHAFMDTERVHSNLPVVITRGTDKFTADGMDFDNLEQLLNMRGRVKGVLTPTAVP